VALGDINGDGVVDLAFAGQGVLVALGNGDGTYQAEYRIGNIDLVPSILFGDFNGNGRLDMVVKIQEYDHPDYYYPILFVPNRSNNR
jgi:hypothetical protein